MAKEPKKPVSPELSKIRSEAGKKGAAGRQESLEKAKALRIQSDQEFKAEVDQLREHCKTLPQTVPGCPWIEIDYDEWLFHAAYVYRGSVTDKEYSEDFDQTEMYYPSAVPKGEDGLVFTTPDEAAKLLLRTYHHLSPELTQFLIRTLEAFLAWHKRHPKQKLDHIPKLDAALKKLKEGKELFNTWTIERLQEEHELQQLRLKQEQQEQERFRIKNIQYTPAPKFVPAPPVVDPLIQAALQAKEDAAERQRLEEDERLRQFAPDAWKYLRQ